MKKQHANFTLIELLIVIGIIALLAGLVMPAIASARASARTTACISNQGQTMKIIAQSMNDNNHFFVSGDNYAADNAASAWNRYLLDKNRMPSLKAARCTALKYNTEPENGINTAGDWENALREAYGVIFSNTSITSPAGNYNGFDFRGTALLTAASGTSNFQISPGSLVFGACTVESASNPDTANNLFDPASNNNARPAQLHGDKCNFFFLDGHAESLDKASMARKYYPATTTNNRQAVMIPDARWLNPEE